MLMRLIFLMKYLVGFVEGINFPSLTESNVIY